MPKIVFWFQSGYTESMHNDWLMGPNLNKLKREKRIVFPLADEDVLLLWVNQEVLAIENACPHQGFPLDCGSLDQAQQILTCPFHQWRFDLQTGKCLHAHVTLAKYQVKIDGHQLWLRKQA